MDRDHLVRLLARDADAFVACRRAAAAGAAVRIWDRCQLASALARTYASRLRLAHQRGTTDIGFAEAAQALRSCGDQLIRLGEVSGEDPPYHFQLFLNETATNLIACLGIDQSGKSLRKSRERRHHKLISTS